MSERAKVIANLGAWVEALSGAVNEGFEITQSGMKDLSRMVFETRAQMIDDDLLIKTSKCTFYDRSELAENVKRLRP